MISSSLLRQVPALLPRLASTLALSDAPVRFASTQRPLTAADEQRVPFLKFPTHEETHLHGMWDLPATEDVPLINPSSLLPYCLKEEAASSVLYRPWTDLSKGELLEVVRMLGLGFAEYEPMCRHLIPQVMPDDLREAEYEDALGRHSWGHHAAKEKGVAKEDLVITMADVITWWIRICFITDPTSEGRVIQEENLKRSTVAIDANTGDFLGALLGVPAALPPSPDSPDHFAPPPECAFHRELNTAVGPVAKYVEGMEAAAIPALNTAYPSMEKAFHNQKVTSCFMISKSSRVEVPHALPVDLFRAHMEQQIALGAEYFTTEASNPWTGAVMEAMGATPTLFAPHRSVKGVVKSDVAVESGPASPNGWVSGKDSGVMFYTGRF